MTASPAKARRARHGQTKSPEYQSWSAAKSRCENPRDPAYSRYGGRGIYMCREWSESYVAFRRDMGERPEGTTLDRKDNDGPYNVQNCKWSTDVEQGRNKRNNRLLTAFGRTQCISAWCEETGIDRRTLWGRLQLGWTVEDALSTPTYGRSAATRIQFRGVEKTVDAWAAFVGMSAYCLRYRLSHGWPLEQALTTPSRKSAGRRGFDPVSALRRLSLQESAT